MNSNDSFECEPTKLDTYANEKTIEFIYRQMVRLSPFGNCSFCCGGHLNPSYKNGVKYIPCRTDTDKYWIHIDEHQRRSLLVIFILLVTIGVFGNVVTIFICLRRKNRLMYKVCLLSLAVSDLIAVTTIGAQHIAALSDTTDNYWRLGSFLCTFLPFAETLAVLVNSVILTCIALDRYQTIVNALEVKWDPSPAFCYTVVCATWSVSAAISYPMLTAHSWYEVGVLYLDCNLTIADCSQVAICMTNSNTTNQTYYSALLVCIFLPITITFIWSYCHIASVVWTKRKPPSEQSTDENSVTAETQTDGSNYSKRPKKPAPNIPRNLRINPTHRRNNYTRQSIKSMERKIRTFRIILTIMVVFLICKLPQWIFTILKYNEDKPTQFYILMHWLAALMILSSVLNPFFYALLNDTLICTDKIRLMVNRLMKSCGCKKKYQKRSLQNSQSIYVVNKNSSQVSKSDIKPRGPYQENEKIKTIKIHL